jgi:hypothetical protein
MRGHHPFSLFRTEAYSFGPYIGGTRAGREAVLRGRRASTGGAVRTGAEGEGGTRACDVRRFAEEMEQLQCEKRDRAPARSSSGVRGVRTRASVCAGATVRGGWRTGVNNALVSSRNRSSICTRSGVLSSCGTLGSFEGVRCVLQGRALCVHQCVGPAVQPFSAVSLPVPYRIEVSSSILRYGYVTSSCRKRPVKIRP